MPGCWPSRDLRFGAVVSIIVAGQGDWTETVTAAWVCYPDHAETVPLVVDQHTEDHPFLMEDHR